jgi:hypothetical protein
VIEQPVRRVAHRPDQGGLIERLRHHRHVLADMGARNLGGERLELAADVARSIGLRIPDIDVAGPALQENHDHRFRGAEPPRPFKLRGGDCILLHRQEVREIQSEQSDGPRAQKLAARGTFAGVTPAAWNNEHDDFPPSVVI